MNLTRNVARPACKAGFVSFVILLLICISSYGQRPSPVAIGSPSPDFKLNVQLAGKGKPVERTLASYKGKWLVLDFWSKSCLACIKGFPKLQSLTDSIGCKVSFILVGKNDEKYNAGIQKMYHRIAREEKLGLDVAFDTVIFQNYGVWATPHIAIISPEGKLHSVTTGEGLDLDLLRKLTGATEPMALLKTSPATPASQIRIIIDTISNFPHQSELKIFSGTPVMGAAKLKLYPRTNRFITLMSNLSSLYKLAYIGSSYWLMQDSLYGTYSPNSILELNDSSAFASNFEKGTGFYSYQLSMDSTKIDLYHAKLALQADLKSWFGFKVKFETRQIPIWELVALKPRMATKLKSKSATSSITGDHSGMILLKKTMQDLLVLIQSYHLDKHIYNMSGIQGDIDIELNASLASFPSVQNALRQNGLDLVQTTKAMQVLIISSP